MTLHTTGLRYEHRQDVKFSNVFLDFHNWYCAERMIKSAVVTDRKWHVSLPPEAAKTLTVADTELCDTI